MKLYIYEHCPFCARVRYVAGMLNINPDLVVVGYDDEKTTVDIIGKKQVPILVKGDGGVISESLNIIEYFLNLSDSINKRIPSESITEWQKQSFGVLQKIGYPRWPQMGLEEFVSDSAKALWRAKKETEELNFDQLVADSAEIAKEAETLIDKAWSVLDLDSHHQVSVVDEAVVFSILRGFFSMKEINWNPVVKNWMESVSKQSNVKLIK
ncbi:GrxB family glutaredoxin [Vibrio crassostreae]|uniref:GrxB family glutaredoxin n=1 Tax=Vibrio crassostreae TaxID=246167 RepID=UPI001BD655A3|nr:GrxB family glutaredoxin [Vibrio crassostreae]